MTIYFPKWVKETTSCKIVSHAYVINSPHGVIHKMYRIPSSMESRYRIIRKAMPKDQFETVIDALMYSYREES